jgi:DNA-binding HxlR family transcriptional regulator
MTRTHEKVSGSPPGERAPLTREAGALEVERVLQVMTARWKLPLLFQLFGGRVLRFSDLERAIPAISQKVPPKVEYRLTAWGQELCPVLDALLRWANCRPAADTPAGANPAAGNQ